MTKITLKSTKREDFGRNSGYSRENNNKKVNEPKEVFKYKLMDIVGN